VLSLLEQCINCNTKSERELMAKYVYQCDCGYREEVTHSIHSEIQIMCSYCEIPLVRKPQRAAVNFKGDGWASRETR
jgi:predicted nucleic acid-binding Zn ribbon protein